MKKILIFIISVIVLISAAGCSKGNSEKTLMTGIIDALKTDSLEKFEKCCINENGIDFFFSQLKLSKDYIDLSKEDKKSTKEDFEKRGKEQKRMIAQLFKSMKDAGEKYNIDWKTIEYIRYDIEDLAADKGMPLELRIVENPRVYFNAGGKGYHFRFDAMIHTDRGWVLFDNVFELSED